MNTANVIIIGAGVVGTSIAFHLAKQGCRDVVIVEKNYIGSGCTEKCAGGVRHQFSAEANIRLSIESVQFFKHFENETGHVCDFHQNGYLILATTSDEMETFHQNVTLQRKLGLEVEILTPQEVEKLVPGLNVEDVLGATFCRADGYADPYSVVTGFAAAAKERGVKIIEDTEVIGIQLRGDRVDGVLTTKGRFAAPVIVNAAGAYARAVGNLVGLDIPVSPTRRHILVTEPVVKHSMLTQNHRWLNLPLVIDFHNGFWFRREGSCLLFGMRNQNEVEGFSTSVDWDFFADVIAPTACQRLPILADIGIMRAQAGLHPDTQDGMAILGQASSVNGLYLACGFGGHGFMHSPAVGKLIAELILGKINAVPDAELFSLDRFDHHLNQDEKALI